MQFYKINFTAYPIIRFAHAIRAKQYQNIITYRKNLIEFSLIQDSHVKRTYEDGSINIIPSESFSLIMPDMNMHLEALEKEKPCYITNLVLKGRYTFERFDTEDIPDIAKFMHENRHDILLPVVLPLYNDYTEIEQLFRLAIMHFMNDDATGQMQAVAVFLEICARINSLFRQSLLQDPSHNYGDYYSNKIKSYIADHYSEKISVPFLAEMLGITPNYLSRIFKENTGKTITKFITLTRLYQARRMAYEQEENIERIAKKVGICNANYLNLLFRRYYGANLHDTLLIDRDISLFHDKPWELGNLTKDVQKEEPL